MVLFTAIAAAISYKLYIQKAMGELNTAARIAAAYSPEPEELCALLEEQLDYAVRVTYIGGDGTVTFDSSPQVGNVSDMDNHGNRPEVEQALNEGFGSDIRASHTIGKRSCYAAVSDGNGTVIRLSREIESVYSLMLGTVSVITVIAGLVIIISTIISVKLSESLIVPVRTMVENIGVLAGQKGGSSETDRLIAEYEELEPVAAAVRKLSARLDRYITRLREERETISVITENMVEGMIVLDSGDNILSVNRSAVRLLSSAFRGGEGRHICELTRNPEILELISRSKEEKSVSGVVGAGGRKLRAFVNNTGENSGTVLLLVDITESFNAEEMRRCFSANVSHELKTPLTTISGFGEMMESGVLTDKEDVKKYGGLIHRESSRLLSLINDIIRLSELDEGGDSLEVRELDINAVAEEVCTMLSDKAAKNGISLEHTGKSVLITANEGMLSEVIYNLADNAIKYNTEGGFVRVDVSGTESTAVLTVSDSGIGIPPEHIEHIFERFYRVDKSRSKQRGGTGLGLSIVKHIVNVMGGSIDISSEVGKGTEVRVEFSVKSGK